MLLLTVGKDSGTTLKEFRQLLQKALQISKALRARLKKCLHLCHSDSVPVEP